MAMGDQHYASVKTEHVIILFEKPARHYEEIGLVSSSGVAFKREVSFPLQNHRLTRHPRPYRCSGRIPTARFFVPVVLADRTAIQGTRNKL